MSQKNLVRGPPKPKTTNKPKAHPTATQPQPQIKCNGNNSSNHDRTTPTKQRTPGSRCAARPRSALLYGKREKLALATTRRDIPACREESLKSRSSNSSSCSYPCTCTYSSRRAEEFSSYHIMRTDTIRTRVKKGRIDSEPYAQQSSVDY